MEKFFEIVNRWVAEDLRFNTFEAFMPIILFVIACLAVIFLVLMIVAFCRKHVYKKRLLETKEDFENYTANIAHLEAQLSETTAKLEAEQLASNTAKTNLQKANELLDTNVFKTIALQEENDKLKAEIAKISSSYKDSAKKTAPKTAKTKAASKAKSSAKVTAEDKERARLAALPAKEVGAMYRAATGLNSFGKTKAAMIEALVVDSSAKKKAKIKNRK